MAKDAKAGDKAKAQRNAADTGEDYTPVATSREIGKNSLGETTIYPSDVEAVASSYNLTTAEAERLLLEGDVSDKAADKIKGERVVYRPHYEYVTNPTSNPLAAADARQAERDAEADNAEAAERIATDKTSPDAGPYGPEAVYTGVEAPVDTDHTSPRQPEDVEGSK
jgi:hypothetical protein